MFLLMVFKQVCLIVLKCKDINNLPSSASPNDGEFSLDLSGDGDSDSDSIIWGQIENKYYYFVVLSHTEIVSCVLGCIYKHASSHDTQIRNNTLWSPQKVAPYGNRTRCTLYGSPATVPTVQLIIY